MRVLVLIPTFNRAGLVPFALNAIAAQTYADWEALVYDDGSSDGTPQAVEAWRKAQPADIRRRVALEVARENRGIGYVRRYLAESFLASGRDLAAWQDSDDSCTPDRLTRQVTRLWRDQADVCYCDIAWSDAVEGPWRNTGPHIRHRDPSNWGELWGREDLEAFRDAYNSGTAVFRPNVADLVPSELLIRRGGYDSLWCWAQIQSQVKVSYIPAPLYLGRLHPDQLTKRRREPEVWSEAQREDAAIAEEMRRMRG